MFNEVAGIKTNGWIVAAYMGNRDSLFYLIFMVIYLVVWIIFCRFVL